MRNVPAIKWLAAKIERWPLERLVPYARNARQHSDAQVSQIAASIVESGFDDIHMRLFYAQATLQSYG